MGLHDRGYYRESYSDLSSSNFRLRDQTAIWIIIAINVVVFIADNFTAKVAPGAHWLGDLLAVSSLTPLRPWLWWQFLTAGFCHAPFDAPGGIWHILGNMLVLWFFGRPIEERYGRSEFFKIYILGLLISNIGWAVVNSALGNEAVAVGASGAVSAILMLFIVNFPRATILFMFIIPMPAWVMGLIMVLSDISNGLNPNSRIAWEAHLIGMAFGALYFRMGWNFGWLNLPQMRSPFRRGPRLRVVGRGDSDDGDDFDELQRQADPILEKIAQKGEASLTAKERKILNEYSRQVRQRRQQRST